MQGDVRREAISELRADLCGVRAASQRLDGGGPTHIGQRARFAFSADLREVVAKGVL